MSPCDVCLRNGKCTAGQGCVAWKSWFLAAWKKINAYAVAHGLEIEELKQDGNES